MAARVGTKIVAGYGQILQGNSRFPISSDQQHVAANNLGFSLLAFN
jgi:hypothetical protein